MMSAVRLKAFEHYKFLQQIFLNQQLLFLFVFEAAVA